ncbi:MAG: hypothetical protein ACK53V_23045, partial [Planctomycetota bacterium]
MLAPQVSRDGFSIRVPGEKSRCHTCAQRLVGLGLQQNDFVTKVISMSLNFGLYLVEQGVISCDQ